MPPPLLNFTAMRNRNLPAKREQKPNIFNYIACQNPAEAWKMLQREGIDVPKNKNAVALAMAEMVMEQGEEAEKKIADIHPDRDLIMKSVTIEKEPEPMNEPEPMASAEGEEGKKFRLDNNTINLMIVSGAVVFTLTSIVLLIRAAK